jgi:cysteine protease ATG4
MRLRRLHVRDMDPSMLFAFIIRDEIEWQEWRRGVIQVQGRSVITVGDTEPGGLSGQGALRQSAVDEIISDDEDDEGLQ